MSLVGFEGGGGCRRTFFIRSITLIAFARYWHRKQQATATRSKIANPFLILIYSSHSPKALPPPPRAPMPRKKFAAAPLGSRDMK